MIRRHREAFNAAFTESRYRQFIDTLTARCGVPIEFRLSETPCFLPQALIDRLADAAQAMLGQLLTDQEYRRAADAIVPAAFRMPSGEKAPTFVQVDFGLVRHGDDVEGRLVELQAFPSLYGFQPALAETARDVWSLDELSVFPAGIDKAEFLRLVGGAILGGHDPAEVVLMEIDPDKQKTLPDFTMTAQTWGVRSVDIRGVWRQGRQLFYNRDGTPTPIRRIYNRVIPDDLARGRIVIPFDYRDDLDVEWTGGPDWFFRISKFSIPFLRHPWVPRTMFLSEYLGQGRKEEGRSRKYDDWLLKPLFSYAGGGIMFGPTDADLDAIPGNERHLYVLQERVAFSPTIDTPHGPTQAEIRMMFVRERGAYRFVVPLVRMGRGKMMGVDHNKGLRWVGAAAALIGRA